jgi:hypothetical protein
MFFYQELRLGVLPSLPRAVGSDLAVRLKSLSKGVGSSCAAKPEDIRYDCVAKPNNHTQLNFLGVAFSNLNLFFKIN